MYSRVAKQLVFIKTNNLFLDNYFNNIILDKINNNDDKLLGAQQEQ